MPKSILQSIQEDSSSEIMGVIYEKVNSLLGAGNQLFAMEFPARPLNGKNYEYATDDCYSVLTKPYPVQEQEFLLSDAMYDVSPIIQGANGEKLSTVYTTVLNNFVPRLETLKSFVNDQKNLRRWLMEEITDEINGEKKTLSRMAMAKELYRQFLEMRNQWYAEKNSRYDKYKEAGDLDGYARWLSSEGLVREEEINNFYNDAVVRGNYHEVLTLLGFLNISSPSEVLEQTKQKMRGSLRRSLDGSSDIYPVQFQPSDWFKALRPNLSPKDLTMATESLLAEYRTKQARLRSLEALLAEQSVIEIPPERQKELAERIADCEDKLARAELEMIQLYGKGALSAVKAVVDIYKETADPLVKAKAAIATVQSVTDGNFATDTDRRIYSIIEGIAKDALEGIAKTFEGQQKVSKEMKQLLDARMAYSEAKVKDMRLQKLRIEEQIKNVQADLDFLTPLVTGTIAESSKDGASGADAPLMTTPTEDTGDNNFIDVIIKTDDKGSFSSGQSSSSSSQSSWNAGGWFWSASGSSSQSSAEEQQKKLEMQKKVEIGFRIKKVAIDRGGWFNPNIFKLSDNYYRLADIKFSKGLHKDQVQEIMRSGRDTTKRLKDLVTYDGLVDESIKKLNYVLPAFPTGFVIAKDITIRIQSSKEESDSSRKYAQQSSNSSGGFLCFRANSGSASESKSESAYFGSSDNFFYMRIPGPQILGWFLEFTPSDNATPYKELDPSLYAESLKMLFPKDEAVKADVAGEDI